MFHLLQPAFDVHGDEILHMFQNHYWYFSETSTYIYIYRSWRKVFLLTITSLSLTSPSHHSHHYLILVIIFKLKVLLETISPLVPPSPSLTAINVKMVTECNCSTPTLLQTHLKHVTPSFVTNTFGNNIQIKFDFLRETFPVVEAFPQN